MRYYPISLNLKEKRCVVIGGHIHAETKVQGLLDAGARVTVIAEEMTENLRKFGEEGRITCFSRDYQAGDLSDAFLVISATLDPVINERIWQEALERNTLINTMDDIPHCNFITPSIVRQGDLTVTISTAGKSPALAVRLRDRLEQEFGPEYAWFLELAGSIRAVLRQRFPDFQTRRARWYELIDSDVIDLLRQGDEQQVRQRVAEILGFVPDKFGEPVETEGIGT